MIFRNMWSSVTTGNFPAVLTQYFTGNTSLRHGLNVSAFPSFSHSDPSEVCFSRLDYGSLTLRPAALLAPCQKQARLVSGPRGRLHPGFRRFGHPLRRRIYLQCQLVPTGQFALAGLSPARSSTSFTAPAHNHKKLGIKQSLATVGTDSTEILVIISRRPTHLSVLAPTEEDHCGSAPNPVLRFLSFPLPCVSFTQRLFPCSRLTLDH